jgi:hypothetical protein
MSGAITPLPQYAFMEWCSVKQQKHRDSFTFTFYNKMWNSVLRRTFGPKKEEDGSWRKLRNDELHSLYSSPNILRVTKSRRLRWAGHVARMGEGRGVYRVLFGRHEDKRPLGRPWRRWEDNIKMDLREKVIEGVNWIRLARERVWLVAGFCEHGNEHSGSIKKGYFFDKLNDCQFCIME